jgi:hypothetical protein
METTMKISKLILTAAAAAILATSGAVARDRDRDGRPDHGWAERHDRDGFNDAWRGRADWHWRDDRGGWHGDHDRYWRHGYGRYVGHDRIYVELRRKHYYRWDGAPYWYQGRYVVRTYDRHGRRIFVEMNPYTGGFIGVIRF